MPSKSKPLTPVRVRGKRHAEKAVKSRRRRSTTPDEHTTRDKSSSAPPAKKRRQELSRLETLPTELLEMIFLDSSNVDLPLVSKAMVLQLSGRHLQRQVVDNILTHFLTGPLYVQKSLLDMEIVESLISRRFFTWEIFSEWLRTRFVNCRFPFDYPYIGEEIKKFGLSQNRVRERATKPHPFPCLLRDCVRRSMPRTFRIPDKLLHGPWTDDKANLLECCVLLNINAEGNDDAEIARISSFGGLRDAIRDHSVRAMSALLNAGVTPAPDFLHFAIMEADFDEPTVRWLFDVTEEVKVHGGQPWPTVDALDPELWAWAEQHNQHVDGRGKLVKRLLRRLHNAR